MKRSELIDVLARWRYEANKSVALERHREALKSRRTSELQKMYGQIAGHGEKLPTDTKHPATLNAITDTVLAYRPKRKR